MRSRVLTVTIGPSEVKNSSAAHYANAVDEDTNTWLGITYDSSPEKAFTRLLKLIIDGIDDPQSHWWRF